MPRVRCRGDFPALSEPFHVCTDLEPLEVKAVLEALTFQSRLGLPGDHILKPSRAPHLQTLVSLRIRGFRSRMQDLCTASALRTGRRGAPKGRGLPTAQGSRHLNPGLPASPLYPNAPQGLIPEPPLHSPKSAPQIHSRFLGEEHRDQVAKEARTARLCGKAWPPL